MAGWFSDLDSDQQRRVIAYTGGRAGVNNLAAIRSLMASPANLVIFPMQDVLGLGKSARMNIPGTLEGNWRWRLHTIISDRLSGQLNTMTELFGRKWPLDINEKNI